MMASMAASGQRRVERIDPEADSRWDAYVRDHRDATAYHLAAWAAILRHAYRFEPRYHALLDETDAIRGVMPLVHKRGVLSGRRLRSLPVVPTGGPLADDDEGAAVLVSHACELSRSTDAALVIEGRAAGLDHGVAGLEHFACPPSWILDLPEPGAEDEWRAARSKNLLRSIRKAERTSLTVREASTEGDLRDFYRIYLLTMRGHRSLPRLYRQLAVSRSALGPEVFRLFLVEDGERTVAGGLFHAFGDTIELLYNASDPDALAQRPNHLLYSHVMAWAREHGLARFDFGFAWPGSSLGGFKALWGSEPVAEHGYVLVPGERRINPAGSPSEEGGESRESLLSGVWRRAPWAAKAWERAPLTATRIASTVAYRYL